MAIFGKDGDVEMVKPHLKAEDWWLTLGLTHCQRLGAERSARGPKDNAATKTGNIICYDW